jgi:hypothetical protein
MSCESAVRIGLDEFWVWETGSGAGTIVVVIPVYDIGRFLAKERENVHVCVSAR